MPYDIMPFMISNGKKLVNCKIIKCGDYFEVYFYNNHYINDKNLEKNINIENVENNLISYDSYNENYEPTFKQIEEKNINRSRLNMERVIKTNEKRFFSFITLTFSDKITNLDYANKELDKFITKIKRKFKNFLCVGVPEFQKNGSVHFHLLTNIDFYLSDLLIENSQTNRLYQKFSESQLKNFIFEHTEEKLIKKVGKKKLNSLDFCFRLYNGKYENTKCNYNKKSNELKIFKTIKYWKNGFTNVIPITDINIIGYMSKYMTKDIDNRLFSRKRYFQYGNLERPKEEYLNLNDLKHLDYLNNNFKIDNVVYNRTYKDYFGNDINFFEFKLNN